MASPIWWKWVWVNSGSWWCTGRPGVLQFTGSQSVGHDWATELNWWDWKTWSYFIACRGLSQLFKSPLSSQWGALIPLLLSVIYMTEFIYISIFQYWIVTMPLFDSLQFTEIQVLDISPCNFDSSLCFIQSDILHLHFAFNFYAWYSLPVS